MRRLVLATSLILCAPAFAHAAGSPCGGPFSAWLDGLRREALASGITEHTLDEAAPLMKIDPSVISKDRGQKVFAQSFVEFAGRMAEGYRLEESRQKIRANSGTFSRIERDFGVPASVIVAFWALETDFGANMGDIPTIRALTSLAHDCRRPELFREQLLAALRILQGHDLTLAQMKGPFAGELGQLQFLPTHYLQYAVDYDGDGHRNLIASTPDALASAANFAARLGWRRGEPWLEEVRVPPDLAWDQCGIDIEHPRSDWARRGVRRIDGSALTSDEIPTSILLPVGRFGPAFLAYPNFRHVHLQWNQSLVYATTAAYLATRIDGAPKMTVRGKISSLSVSQIRALQQELARRGYAIDKIDGVAGVQTRAAVRELQQKLGMAADSYPTTELLAKLHAAARP